MSIDSCRTRSSAPQARHARSVYQSATSWSARSSARGLDPPAGAPDPLAPLGLDRACAPCAAYSSSSSALRASSSARIDLPARPHRRQQRPTTARLRAISPASAARANPSAAARSACSVGARQLPGALAVPEREPRARERRSRAPRRAPRAPAATSSTAGASKRTSWQRERIVGSTSASRSVSRIRCTNDAGSSSVFSIRLAASSPSSSTRSITNTRRPDSNGVLLGRRDDRPVDVADEDLVGAARRDPGQIGMGAGGARARALVRIGEPAASSSAAIARAAAACRRPPGPWNR